MRSAPWSSFSPNQNVSSPFVSPGLASHGPPLTSDTTMSSFVVASVIFACWAASSSEPLAKLSGVASLTMLDVPHEEVEDGGGGGGSGQFTHFLCSASHGSWVGGTSPLALCPCGHWPFPQAAATCSTVRGFARVACSAPF